MTHRNAWLGTFLIALGLLGLVTAKAHEQNGDAPAVVIEKRFTVEKVLLRDLDATLRIDTYDGSVVRVKATGSRPAIDRLRMTASGSRLEITQHGTIQNTANPAPTERDIVIRRSGGSAVFFGGAWANGPPPPLRLLITLPRRVLLTVRGRIGAATLSRDGVSAASIRHAAREPDIDANGVARVDIGNR
jgi:hypothetical protein